MNLNRAVILSNLKEAQEQLDEMIELLNSEPDYDEGCFKADLTHAYHHLNMAWNARFAAEEAYRAMSDEDFYRWRAFPANIDLS